MCFGQIIVEPVAHNQLRGKKVARLLSCLTAAGLQIALIFSFASRGKLERNRLARDHPQSHTQ